LHEVSALRGTAVSRGRFSIGLPTQAFFLMTMSIAIVAGALILHQGESIKERVLVERLAAVSRHGHLLESNALAGGVSADRMLLRPTCRAKSAT
jgi:hypothetical protein